MKMGKYISGVGVLIAFVMMPHFLGAGTPFRVCVAASWAGVAVWWGIHQ